MTHDELLRKIEFAGQTSTYIALRKIAELHIPRLDLASTCSGCALNVLYPCPTIQSIEKEL